MGAAVSITRRDEPTGLATTSAATVTPAAAPVPSKTLAVPTPPLIEPARAPTPFASPNNIAETYRTMRLRVFGKPRSGLSPTSYSFRNRTSNAS